MYKTVDLFGNEQTILEQSKTPIHKKDFTDYDGFVDKFKTLKTTDDCYTPDNVFKVILDYVDSKYSLDGKRIIRPFYPDGDYKSIDYMTDCVVIDNPPFSIISEIAKFYVSRKIPFFLFAPHMTLFTSDIDCTHLVVGANIIYANGANVKTSFLSNMLGDAKIIGDADLYKRLKSVIAKDKVNLPKYEYPPNVLTVSMVSWMVEKGVSINIGKSHVKHVRQLADQKKHGKVIFGSGFLISKVAAADKAAAYKAAKDKAAEDKAAEDKAAEDKAAEDKAAEDKAAEDKVNSIIWELSPKEIDIIESLGTTK